MAVSSITPCVLIFGRLRDDLQGPSGGSIPMVGGYFYGNNSRPQPSLGSAPLTSPPWRSRAEVVLITFSPVDFRLCGVCLTVLFRKPCMGEAFSK
ncbi:hypothetical protein E2C01_035171 [Portunus trituberculatus]|uniref:Uncharacterized protein n=1 Tax=Portunus trituberculatus TaxID=210409 RepID=A0A5B7F502_PORTR|nr:hypothetical protein [Portunus trituberculatus]